jgi:hypothetical protein
LIFYNHFYIIEMMSRDPFSYKPSEIAQPVDWREYITIHGIGRVCDDTPHSARMIKRFENDPLSHVICPYIEHIRKEEWEQAIEAPYDSVDVGLRCLLKAYVHSKAKHDLNTYIPILEECPSTSPYYVSCRYMIGAAYYNTDENKSRAMKIIHSLRLHRNSNVAQLIALDQFVRYRNGHYSWWFGDMINCAMTYHNPGSYYYIAVHLGDLFSKMKESNREEYLKKMECGNIVLKWLNKPCQENFANAKEIRDDITQYLFGVKVRYALSMIDETKLFTKKDNCIISEEMEYGKELNRFLRENKDVEEVVYKAILQCMKE